MKPTHLVCSHCQKSISLNQHLSGVKNRNHCPHCLWSIHLDETAGDRQSPCHGQMEPIALTFKYPKKNKYQQQNQKGETLLVHFCHTCFTLRLNRLAADDDPQKILTVFQNSQHLPPEKKALFPLNNLTPADQEDEVENTTQLFGTNNKARIPTINQ